MKILKSIIAIFMLLASSILQQTNGMTNLPVSDLAWKNISINGHSTTVYCLNLDSKGMMWAGTDNGLYFYDGMITHPINDKKLTGAKVYAIIEYKNILLLGTNNGLLSFNRDNGNIDIINRTPKEIRSMLLLEHTLWIGSLYGVYSLDLANGNIHDLSIGLPHKSTYSLLRDSRGMIYAGTYDGLARWNPAKKKFIPIKMSSELQKSHNLFVNCLLESNDGNFLYVGCEGAIYKYMIAENKWERISSFDGNNIKSLARINNEHLLFGTDNGVYETVANNTIRHYRHDSRQDYTLADNEIWCLLTDDDSNVWVGHNRGFSISSHSNTIRTLRLSTLAHTGDGNEIHNILRDSYGCLWLGGTNGILKLPKHGSPLWFRHDKSPKSLSHNRIRAIREDMSGDIWLSTDGGLNRFNRTSNTFDVFHVVDPKGGHNTNWVYAMEEDSTSYWIGGFLGGLHQVAKSKFKSNGGIVHSNIAINADGDLGTTKNNRLANNFVNDIVKDNMGNIWVLLFRDDILTCYNPGNKTMTRFNIYKLCGNYPSMIKKDNQGRIWCTFNGGAIIFSDKKNYKIIRFAKASEDEAVIALGPVGKDMWVSTQSNVWKIDGKTLKAKILPIPQKTYTAIYEDTLTKRVLLGGKDEILEVDLSNLVGTSGFKSIKLALINIENTNFTRYDLNKQNSPISIPYGGSISLIVSSLDYSPETVHRYMYKLAESKTDTIGGWTILPEGINTISFNELKMGSFELLIKRVGMADSPISIPLEVSAPLLLSWWAILGYILIAAGVIYGIVMYLHRRNQRIFQEKERQKNLESVEKKLTFLSNISHDLKTPLSMILGPVSLMKERSRDPETQKSLETIYNNAVRLNNMIHKTLELHRLEDNEDSLLILSTFDIVEFCKGVFETFKENHPQKNFIFHSSCSDLFIEGDAVKFESIITNLLSNACKYSEEGATISCGISKQDDNVEIVVSDDGMGIEEVDQPLVFQRMFRAPSTAKLQEGTGLGLYLIKKYLELMKGNIDFYSKKGQGTAFTVTLPISNKEITKKNKEPYNDNKGKSKILIVEDNSEISFFISNLLDNNYTLLSADNGRSGLAIASSFSPDLVIVDEMMPIMTGLEMCQRMKQIPRLASIPIIMLTAKSDNQTENESIKLGIDVFMPKPFEPNVLFGRINYLLKSRNEIKEKVRIQTITEARPIEAESATEKQLAKIAKIIEDNVSDPDLNVNFLCEKSGIPQKQLYRMIKKYMGVAPLDYIRRVRLQKAAMLLSQKRFTVSEISYMVGFKTPSYFAKCFQIQFGVKPSLYQEEKEITK
ncbi:hybrid sensor histidine kinase/response regulator transcription factor [Prevotella sp.]|uniref:hybrid sensor histidine kinase/response regulator transcription factor n=1 Tax=Prevotella sp. TaxID=59823 RepID=UPI002F9426AF